MFRAAPILVFVLFVLSTAACGGSSPTEAAPATLNVAGTWEGFWNDNLPFGGEDIFMTMVLTQGRGSNRVTGRVTFLGQTWDISGETTYEAPGEGRFVWDDDETVCPVLSGDLDVAAGENMAGPARLDGRGCPEPDFFDGPMQLRRRSA